MRISRPRWFLPLFVMPFLASPGLFAADQSLVEQIIQRSVDANKLDWDAAPEYNNFERDREDGRDTTYEVLMIEGSPYQRLVAVNGKPLTTEEQAQRNRSCKKRLLSANASRPSKGLRALPVTKKIVNAITF